MSNYIEAPTSERSRDYYNRAYFCGNSPVRGSFSLLDINTKYIDRAHQIINTFELNHVCSPVILLEVGAGAAPFTRIVDSYHQSGNFDNIRVLALDFSSQGVAQLPDYPKPDFIQSDIYRLPIAKESVEGVVAWDVLEHLNHPGVALKEIYRVTKQHGFLHAVVPNPESYLRYTDKDTYLRDKSHVIPPLVTISFFQNTLKDVGFDYQIFTRGFPEGRYKTDSVGGDLLLPADKDQTGTHIVIFAIKP